MSGTVHSLLIVAVLSLTTIALRAFPFVIFGGKKEVPGLIKYLGDVLPCSIMAALVIYCMKGVSLFAENHGLPELIAAGIVALLHLWKKNTLLSIGAGTILYMVMIQFVFV